MIRWANPLTLEIFGIKYCLVETSPCAPEQYDVYADSKLIGFLRLRSGAFRAEYKDRTVYQKSDPDKNDLFFDLARDKYLTEAILAIHLQHTAEK